MSVRAQKIGVFLGRIISRLTAVLPRWDRSYALGALAETLPATHRIETRFGAITFVCPSYSSVHFPRTFHDREKDTIEWIDSFQPESVFWDVGAGVGTYSLYAGLHPGIRVIAFEPCAPTYSNLVQNINASRLVGAVQAYPIALTGGKKLDVLNMNRYSAGMSCNSFGERPTFKNKELEIRFQQSTVGFSLDLFAEIFTPPLPHYLKIDVDGLEDKILDGGGSVLQAKELRSVLIEVEGDLRAPRNSKIVERMTAFGFSNNIDPARAFGESSFNVIFRR